MPNDPPWTYGTLARKAGGPQDASYQSFLKGKAALEREDLKLAEVNFAQALHLSPNNAQAMIFLLYAQLKRRPTLRETSGLQDSLKLAPNDPLTLRTAAKVEVILDHAPKAMALLEKARSIDPSDAELHAELASGYLSLRKRSECEAALKEAFRLAPDNALALSVKASFAKVYVDANTAQLAAEQTLRKSSNSAASHIFEGKAAIARNEMANGYWHLREAVRLEPKSREAREALEAALKQRFPLYDWFCRFSVYAARMRIISTMMLVYAIARPVMLALSNSQLPLSARPPLIAASALFAAFAALLLWPMLLINFALRFHPICRDTRTKIDRAENAFAVTTLLAGVTGLVLCPVFKLGGLALVGGIDIAFFATVVAGSTQLRDRSTRVGALSILTLLWIAANALCIYFALRAGSGL